MLSQNEELKFELLKSILANPSNKIMEIDVDKLSETLSTFVQAIWKSENRPESKAKP